MTRSFDPHAIVVPLLAVAAAMLVGMALIGAIGYDPFYTYGSLINGAVGGPSAIGGTLLRSAPIILTGLSVMVAFRAGLFNIGGTGQAIVGMFLGGIVAIHLGALPGPLHWTGSLLFAAIGGGLWGALAGFLKVARGAHEVVVTIMLNYIAISFGQYLLRLGGPLQEKGVSIPQSPAFETSAHVPVFWRPDPLTEVHVGIGVALLAAAAVWFLIARTSLGYQIRAVGLAPDAAEYGGMSVTKVTVMAMFIAGALAGLGGAVQTFGEQERLQQGELEAIQIGFTGIAVALLGRNTAIGCVLAGLLMGALESGSSGIQSANALPSGLGPYLIQVIQGVVVLFVGVDIVFRRLSTRIVGTMSAGGRL